MATPYYAVDLLDPQDVPAGFEKALTIAGLWDHGRESYPLEWGAILKHKYAVRRLFDHFISPRPNDGTEIDDIVLMLTAIADRK